ncbi:MAG: hypothetical protein R3C19_27455, partial [Planctomycetaceae bacterium]
MSPSETLQNDRESAHTASAWVTSLLFWCALVVSVLLYGGVALAPKLSVWMQVRHQYLRNAQHLLALDSEVDYLERVQNALETDPDF